MAEAINWGSLNSLTYLRIGVPRLDVAYLPAIVQCQSQIFLLDPLAVLNASCLNRSYLTPFGTFHWWLRPKMSPLLRIICHQSKTCSHRYALNRSFGVIYTRQQPGCRRSGGQHKKTACASIWSSWTTLSTSSFRSSLANFVPFISTTTRLRANQVSSLWVLVFATNHFILWANSIKIRSQVGYYIRDDISRLAVRLRPWLLWHYWST